MNLLNHCYKQTVQLKTEINTYNYNLASIFADIKIAEDNFKKGYLFDNREMRLCIAAQSS